MRLEVKSLSWSMNVNDGRSEGFFRLAVDFSARSGSELLQNAVMFRFGTPPGRHPMQPKRPGPDAVHRPVGPSRQHGKSYRNDPGAQRHTVLHCSQHAQSDGGKGGGVVVVGGIHPTEV